MPPPLKPGITLGKNRYRIQSVLGQGGFSIVYSATDAKGRIWAIKEIIDGSRCMRGDDGCAVNPRPDIPQAARIHEHQKKRARQEFAKFKNWNLKNLVTPQDLIESNGTVYLVMRLIRGQLLASRLQNQYGKYRIYGLKEALDVILPVLDAVSALHNENLIHRDLKPDNIIIDEAGNAIVLDTGAARSFEAAAGCHTGIMTLFGAPETETAIEIKRFGAPGPWTDTFALTGLLFILLNGRMPPGWSERDKQLLEHKSDLLCKPPNLPDYAWKVLKKGLRLQTTERYESVNALKRALREVAEHHNQKLEESSLSANSTASPIIRSTGDSTPKIATANSKQRSTANITSAEYSQIQSFWNGLDLPAKGVVIIGIVAIIFIIILFL